VKARLRIPSSGFSFIEILLVLTIVSLVTIPIALIMRHASREARASIDEFYAALYLSELSDQLATLAPQDLPEPGTTIDLLQAGSRQLIDGNPRSTVIVSGMRSSFESRRLVIEPTDSGGAGTSGDRFLKMYRIDMVYQRPGGKSHEVSTTGFTSRALSKSSEGGN